MPSLTSAGKVKANYVLDPQAYELLGKMAENQRAHGEFISGLILAEWERRQTASLADRVGRLEAQVTAILARLGGDLPKTS